MIKERAFKPGDSVVGSKMGHPFAPQEARLIATIDARDAEIARLREALEIFATESNWRLGGPFDPNSPSFTGIGFASAALKEARHD